jgi:negative regulator of sigma-B (phosphoserine phosphatase)
MVEGTESGDAYVVKESPEGVLIAVIDGVGHGREAAEASRLAAATVESALDEDAVSLLWRCHEELKGSRGAVMTLAFVCRREKTMTWIGVGNIESVLFHTGTSGRQRPDHVLLRGGIVGHRLPPLRAQVLSMAPNDVLIFATDGIRPEFSEAFTSNGEPQAIADRILAQYRKGNDDALVLVVRYLGDEPQ